VESNTQSVTLVNAFEVPPEADEPFIGGWERARDFLATTDGFGRPRCIGRCVRTPTFGLSTSRWSTRRRHGGRRSAIRRFPGGRLPFRAHPGLYEVVQEDGTPDGREGVVLTNPFEVPAEGDATFLQGWRAPRDVLAAEDGYLGRGCIAASARPISVS
jgi:hypothetical protein